MGAQPGREFLLKEISVGTAITGFSVDTTDNELDAVGHGLVDNDRVLFGDDAAPVGLEEGKIYYVVGSTVDLFSLSETEGGAEIDLTGDAGGDCKVYPVTAITTVSGCTENALTINNDIVDVSTKDDRGWRRLMEGVSLKSLSISATGRHKTAAAKASIVNKALTGDFDFYQVVSGLGDKFEGAFQLNNYNTSGPNAEADQFDFALESSGGVAYTAGS